MDDVERIKQKIDIVDLISQYILLKKAGRNFKTLCPFHSEKTSSFIVSPERQIWHCFGCGKGGDQFSFLMEYEKVEFSEALRFLADKAGIKLTGPIFKTEIEKKKELIYTLNLLAANFYHYLLLNHPVGKSALSYLLKNRHIPLFLVKQFNLGYAPKRKDALSTYLIKKKGYREQDLIDAGLSQRREDLLFDFFRNRIIFPIKDARENIIAFSGRVLDDETTVLGPKYINTRETLVYKKGGSLFGIDQAKSEIKKSGKAILVEGEFDVISSHRFGIKNIIAVKGTALTTDQIRLLKRYVQKIIFCFDTDPAGTSAQRRSIELIEQEGITSSVIVPQKGKDPDGLLNEDPDLFKNAIGQAVPVYDFIIDSALSSYDPTDPEGKREILNLTLSYLVIIENEVVKEHYFKKLAKGLETSYESLVRQAEKIKTQKPQALTQTTLKKPEEREEVVERYLLSLILQGKLLQDAFLYVEKNLAGVELTIPSFQRLLKHLGDFIKRSRKFNISRFIKTLPKELVDTFDICLLSLIPNFPEQRLYFRELEKVVGEVRTLSIKKGLKDLSIRIREEEQAKKLEELEKLKNKFHQLTQLMHKTKKPS